MAACSRCATESPPAARFCMGCGQPLTLTCSSCDAALPVGARFCPSCGTRTGEGVMEVGETLKLVTILFADVVGSTAQAEHMPPDEVRALMAEFFEAMIEEIKTEGGTVERLIGDAIMADFGVPIAHEDDPVRAVRAALRMLDRLDRFNAERAEGLQIQIRIGINTGQVSTGGSLGERLMVMGDSVNVAARLEQAAAPGQILVGERTARAVRDHFVFGEVVELSAKGKAEPLRATVVQRRAELARKPGPLLPLIGRAAESQRLAAALESVEKERTPHLVTIVGEPGAGKTRLLEEFVSSSDGRAMPLVGRCPQSEGGITLWPFRDLVRNAARINSDDPSDQALGKIERLVRDAASGEAPDLVSRAVGAMASTMGLQAALESLSGLDPREVRREMFAAWVTLLRDLSKQRPLVLVIEDLHWADPPTLELISHLVEAVEGPVLFVCSARPDFLVFHADWVAGIRNYTSVRLTPLSQKDSKELATQVLARVDLPPNVERKLLEAAAGNPLFIRELSLRLLDEDIGSGGADWSELDIPDSVQGLIQARLDLLPGEERAVIQRAAVVGRTFWDGLLRELCGLAPLDAVLRDLTRRQLVSQRASSSIANETEFVFNHVLIRDVSYESLPRRIRGETHAEVAQWMESRGTGRTAELAEILTDHYVRAFDLLKEERHRIRARVYALVAASNALRRYAVVAAEKHAESAVRLSRLGREKVEALEAIGDLYLLTDKSQSAYEAYKDALREQQETDPTGKAHVARLAGKAAIVATRWWGTMDQLPSEQELRSLIEDGLEACTEDQAAARARLLSSKSFASARGFRFAIDGTDAARQAVEVAEETGQPDLISMAHDALAASLFPTGGWHEIHQINLRRVQLVPQLSDVREICDAYGMAAVSSVRKGLSTDARRFAGKEIARAKGVDAGSYLQGLVWGVVGSFILGDWQRVVNDQQEIEKMKPQAPALPGPMAMRAYVVTMLSHELRGEASEADRYMRLFEEYVETERSRGFTVGGLPEAARVLAHRGEFAKARDLLPLERGEFLTLDLEAFCDVLRLGEDWEEADAIVSMAHDEASAQELPLLRSIALRLQGVTALATGASPEGLQLLERSAEGFSDIGAVWEEAVSRSLLAEALHGLGDPTALEHARAAVVVFERLGSVRELDRARKITTD